MPEFMNDVKTMSLEELRRKYQGPANVMFGIRRLISQLKAAWTRIEMLNATLKQEMDMEAKVQKLEAQLLAAKAALEDAVKSWGDYAPSPQSKAATVLHKMKDALTTLSDIESAEACVEVTCFKDHDTVWDASEQPGTDDTHKGILIVKKRKEGGAND